jgi:hypothetical protein
VPTVDRARSPARPRGELTTYNREPHDSATANRKHTREDGRGTGVDGDHRLSAAPRVDFGDRQQPRPRRLTQIDRASIDDRIGERIEKQR